MSLRISSIDPREPRAPKGCRRCNRRRVICDRCLPGCRKCALRGEECPGYGLNIRWEQGLASRGKLTGKALPISGTANTSGPSSKSLPAASRSPSGSTENIPENDSALSTSTPASTVSPSPEYDFNLGLQLPGTSKPSSERYLVQYYDQCVAPVMAWVDGPDNGWRTVIMPLAMQFRPLLYALLAVSAHHLAPKSNSTAHLDSGISYEYYRDESLRLLAMSLQSELAEDYHSARSGPESGILATILLLCDLEMIDPISTLWLSHWKAARTITRRWTTLSQEPGQLDASCFFLVKEAFVYDVFASSTTWTDDDQISGSILQNQNCDLLIEYLQLLQEITHYERHRQLYPDHVKPGFRLNSIHDIQDAFDAARACTANFRETNQSGLHIPPEDFNLIVDCFHHAALAYSYQVLLIDEHSVPARKECVDKAIEAVNGLGRSKSNCDLQHNLAWPLFIIGTESRNDQHRQHFTEQHLQAVTKSKGFSNCLPALDFLRRYWKANPSVFPTWISLARQESMQGSSFVVI